VGLDDLILFNHCKTVPGELPQAPSLIFPRESTTSTPSLT
jgi:hypothetical protein